MAATTTWLCKQDPPFMSEFIAALLDVRRSKWVRIPLCDGCYRTVKIQQDVIPWVPTLGWAIFYIAHIVPYVRGGEPAVPVRVFLPVLFVTLLFSAFLKIWMRRYHPLRKRHDPFAGEGTAGSRIREEN